jgi:serine/threonine-protein kinase HipA
VKNYAQFIDGKKRRPEMIAGWHWKALAREIGYRPTDVKNRVPQVVDAIVMNRAKVTNEVTALPVASAGYVVQSAEAVEENALRMAGKL